jgi:16S rRNA (guanine966-N2)-methyltransferase
MRIIAGQWRGCVLQAPAGLTTRPTADRARQTLFDMILHASWGGRAILADGAVLDVFAGSGAFGLEALSRGASTAHFIEQDRAALACLRANIARCHAATESHVYGCSALQPPQGAPCRIVFLDPPYGQGLVEPALAALEKNGWIDNDTVVIAEVSANEVCPVYKRLAAERQVGAAKFCVWRQNVG